MRRRQARILWGCVLLATTTAFVLLSNSLNEAEQWGTILSSFVALIALLASIVPRTPQSPDVNDAAESLAQAVRDQWRSEERRRKIQEPIPLPIRWQLAPDRLTDHWSNICRSPAGVDSGPLDLAGELNGIVDVYRRIPSKRLVVLGQTGSGKSILAIRFVLETLGPPSTSVTVVPVIFNLGSWNPGTPLRDWLISQLERDHPGLAVPGPGASTLAAALVDGDRIMPVLDGFDEIANGLHHAALDALNNEPTMPVLLTSRRAQYAAAVAGTKVLTCAAGIELTDLSIPDLEHYLPRTTRKVISDDMESNTSGTNVWNPVLSHLRDRPEHPASVVLRTPLMIALARAIYSEAPDHDPSALLDTNRFSSPEAVKDHLLEAFISTAYRDLSPTHHERTLRWLGYLADHLDRLGTRDLAWWEMGNSTRRSTRMLVTGLISGMAIGLIVWLVTGLTYALGGARLAVGPGRAFTMGLLNGLICWFTAGLVFGLAHGLGSRFHGTALEPSRVHIRIRGRVRQSEAKTLRRFMVGAGAGLMFGSGSALVVGLIATLLSGSMLWLKHGLTIALFLGTVIGVGGGIGLGLTAWLEAPIDIRSAVSPTNLLHTNRTTVLVQSLILGPLFGIGVGFASGLEFGIFPQPMWGGIEFNSSVVVGLMAGFSYALGGAFGFVLSLTAWGQWLTLSRIWLPLTGRLPWTVTTFMEDAHRRGVLRQAGAVYQFRHARLQDHLGHTFRADQLARRRS